MSKQKQKLLSDWFTKEGKIITNNDLNHMDSADKSNKMEDRQRREKH